MFLTYVCSFWFKYTRKTERVSGPLVVGFSKQKEDKQNYKTNTL